jgi:hypothetical protein
VTVPVARAITLLPSFLAALAFLGLVSAFAWSALP